MYESSDSQFFWKTTTGIQSRPGTSDESKLIMTFLTNVGVMGIIYTVFDYFHKGKQVNRYLSHQD